MNTKTKIFSFDRFVTLKGSDACGEFELRILPSSIIATRVINGKVKEIIVQGGKLEVWWDVTLEQLENEINRAQGQLVSDVKGFLEEQGEAEVERMLQEETVKLLTDTASNGKENLN